MSSVVEKKSERLFLSDEIPTKEEVLDTGMTAENLIFSVNNEDDSINALI